MLISKICSIILLLAGTGFVIQTCSANAATQDPFKIPDSLKARLQEVNREKQDIRPVVQLPKLNVEGLIWGARPQAIINGEVVNEGGVVQDVTVKRISKEGIVLVYKGIEFTITMKEWQAR